MEPALDAMVKTDMQAMMLAQGGTGFQARHILPKLALARGLPMCSYSKETFEDGALLSYAPDQVEMCRRSAIYLRGAKPSELPVEQPTKLELLINLKTAKALGLELPPHNSVLHVEVSRFAITILCYKLRRPFALGALSKQVRCAITGPNNRIWSMSAFGQKQAHKIMSALGQ